MSANWRVAFETDPTASVNEQGEDPELIRDLSKIGTGNSPFFGNESEPFEVWSYELEGDPLLPEFQLRLQDVGLTLIFTDRAGYGEYELVYRSEDFEF